MNVEVRVLQILANTLVPPEGWNSFVRTRRYAESIRSIDKVTVMDRKLKQTGREVEVVRIAQNGDMVYVHYRVTSHFFGETANMKFVEDHAARYTVDDHGKPVFDRYIRVLYQ